MTNLQLPRLSKLICCLLWPHLPHHLYCNILSDQTPEFKMLRVEITCFVMHRSCVNVCYVNKAPLNRVKAVWPIRVWVWGVTLPVSLVWIQSASSSPCVSTNTLINASYAQQIKKVSAAIRLLHVFTECSNRNRANTTLCVAN